jgi:hypothetical protein
MARPKKEDATISPDKSSEMDNNTPSIHDTEWTDYVLSMLSDDEKIKGNPTTDGLRRIFEKALNCRVIGSKSQVTQNPEPNNEKRATVIHSITYRRLNETPNTPDDLYTVVVDGAADVYWGNCDKVYRNHPVAVAETRAEGRALRRALRLRKVISAEEMVENVDDHPDQNSVNKITNNQINFIDVIAQRLNINVSRLLETSGLDHKNIYNISHEDAVGIIRNLSKFQQDISLIREDIKPYSAEWK